MFKIGIWAGLLVLQTLICQAKEKPFDINSWKLDSVTSIGRMFQVCATLPKSVGKVDIRINNKHPCHNVFGFGKQKSDCHIDKAGEDMFDEKTMRDTVLQKQISQQQLVIVLDRDQLQIMSILDASDGNDSTASIVFTINGVEKSFLHKFVKSDKDNSFNDLIDFTSDFINGDFLKDSLKAK